MKDAKVGTCVQWKPCCKCECSCFYYQARCLTPDCWPTSKDLCFFSVYVTKCINRYKDPFFCFICKPIIIYKTYYLIPYKLFTSECVAPSRVSLLMKCCGSGEVEQQLVWCCRASDRVVPASCCWHPHAHHRHIVLWHLATRKWMVEKSGNDQSSPYWLLAFLLISFIVSFRIVSFRERDLMTWLPKVDH